MIRKSCLSILVCIFLSLGVNWFVLDLLPHPTQEHNLYPQGRIEPDRFHSADESLLCATGGTWL
jgi:hypothetical protein